MPLTPPLIRGNGGLDDARSLALPSQGRLAEVLCHFRMKPFRA